jgi:hypothetical protein
MEAALARSKPNSSTKFVIQPGVPPGTTCLHRRILPIASGSIPPSIHLGRDEEKEEASFQLGIILHNSSRIIRLVHKWLKAGVLEDGVVSVSERGTGQGAVISPLLANIYRH